MQKKKKQNNIVKVREISTSMFYFRRYKKPEGKIKILKHPKLIVGRHKNYLYYMGLTESAKNGKRNNIPIHNPITGDTRPAHIIKELKTDKENMFFPKSKKYHLHPDDKPIIINYLKQKRDVHIT